MQTIALIPARGGSRRLPGKNLRLFGGLPLIVWTIRAAIDAAVFDRIFVSSEDEKILAVALEAGAEIVRRPLSLALDDSSSMDVVRHACDSLSPLPDLVVLLQPTSPLRRASDIREILHLMETSGAPSAVSVCERVKHPEWAYRLDANGRLHSGNSMDVPHVVGLNGAIYVARRSWLESENKFVGDGTVGLQMPSEFSVDIDTLEEFEEAERQLVCR